MLQCLFEVTQNEDGSYTNTCQRCGVVRHSKGQYYVRNCDVKTEILAQDIVSLGLRLAEERRKWVQSGKPYRTAERIAEIFDEKCKPCEFFNQEGESKGSCGVCGCRLLREGKFLNKLAWATTQCPLTPPKWESETIPSKPKGVFSSTNNNLPEKLVVESQEKPTQQTIESPKEGGCGCGR